MTRFFTQEQAQAHNAICLEMSPQELCDTIVKIVDMEPSDRRSDLLEISKSAYRVVRARRAYLETEQEILN